MTPPRAMLILALALLCGCAGPKVTTEWIGGPVMFKRIDRDYEGNWYRVGVESGLRSDGVVVWREAEEGK